MIAPFALLLLCQLAGELAVRAAKLPLPGPVLGLVIMFLLLHILPGLAQRLAPVAHGLLAHLSLLFVPAGVGVLQHAERIRAEGIGIVIALLLSTALAIAAAALVFHLVARRLGIEEAEESSGGPANGGGA